jgi:hypothetical protein
MLASVELAIRFALAARNESLMLCLIVTLHVGECGLRWPVLMPFCEEEALVPVAHLALQACVQEST